MSVFDGVSHLGRFVADSLPEGLGVPLQCPPSLLVSGAVKRHLGLSQRIEFLQGPESPPELRLQLPGLLVHALTEHLLE